MNKVIGCLLGLTLLFACASPSSRDTSSKDADKHGAGCATEKNPYQGTYGPYRYPAMCPRS